ncbi:MAG TPA: D-xylose ABC transporter ATP-binding protein [Firmicutes bacterium]|jgi:ribose transport system ATP-binding protein|nr:D-xylose ABC transporter ATP-binding protein [Bacillota bacterium]
MPEIILKMENIVKDFPGVRALNQVSLEARRGEVLALIGENGAGKSTLMKVLSGVITPDQGDIFFKGSKVQIKSPQHAQELGISIIHQEFNLIPYLSAAENIFFGKEPCRKVQGFINWRELYKKSTDLLKELEIDLDIKTPVSKLSVAYQQMVEITKALSTNADVIIMDEPSATLTQHEIDNLFRIIRSLTQKGVTIIYISHRLEELFAISDRVTVMRDGCTISTMETQNITRKQLISLMVGREFQDEFPKRKSSPGIVALSVKGLSNHKLKSVDMEFRSGEVVGISGLVGAGRTEFARAIFGADPIQSGKIEVFGKKVNLKSPKDAIGEGIGLVPEDRKLQGLILGMSIKENITYAAMEKVINGCIFNWSQEREYANQYVRELNIKTPGIWQKAINLSGGNQQKVVLAKWLFVGSKILILDEPTRGIDVGAKREIYQLINNLAEQGIAIILISSELTEILGMSDRIYVMHEGRVSKMLSGSGITEQQVLTYATGGENECKNNL